MPNVPRSEQLAIRARGVAPRLNYAPNGPRSSSFSDDEIDIVEGLIAARMVEFSLTILLFRQMLLFNPAQRAGVADNAHGCAG
jgi:hypothetical protein